MKELIQEIVDADRAAQEEIAEAKKQRMAIGDAIKKEAELRKAKYADQAAQEISRQRLAAEKQEQARWEEKQAYYEGLKRELQEVFAKNKDAWASEIVTRVLEK